MVYMVANARHLYLNYSRRRLTDHRCYEYEFHPSQPRIYIHSISSLALRFEYAFNAVDTCCLHLDSKFWSEARTCGLFRRVLRAGKLANE